jgi:hypothetical protein
VQAVERSGTLGNQVLASFGKQAQHFRFGLGIDPDHSTFMLRTHLRFGRISLCVPLHWRARRTLRLWVVFSLSHTSFESLPHAAFSTAGRKPRTSQPCSRQGGRTLASDPYNRRPRSS